MAARLKLDEERFATALLFLGLALVACLMPAQNDTWWLLRAGQEMWRSRHIMLRDEFTHTVAGQYWPNHEWLTQVVFYGIYRIGGLPLLTALCAAAVLAAWLIVLQLTPGSLLLRLMLVGCGAALSTAGWSLRPQPLTMAMFAATLWVLVRSRFLWILPPLFLVWANLHGAVATGGLLLAAAVIAQFSYRRSGRPSGRPSDGLKPGAYTETKNALAKLTGIAGLCFLATAATPLGPSLWLEIPRSLERLKVYDVIEWRAPSLANPADLPFWIVAGGMAVLIVRRRGALRSPDAATLAIATALMLLLALRSTRNHPLFLLCAVPAAATLVAGPAATRSSIGSRRRQSAVYPGVLAAAALALVVFVACAWRTPLRVLEWTPLSEQTFAAIAGCDGPLYNRYDEGGYIIWFLPDRKVFVDSRQDPFPEHLVLEQLRVEETGDYAATFRRYGISCALTPAGSLLARRLGEDGWHAHPAGEAWTVYSRPG